MKDNRNKQPNKGTGRPEENQVERPQNEFVDDATLVEPEVFDTLDTEGADVEDFANAEMEANAKLQKELDETKAQLEKEKKEYLFLMADFDNFRKRVVKEKAELIKNGAEKALKAILPIVDDFERGLEATKDVEDAASVRSGMELIYNKFVKYLADNGVTPMETDGKAFDPDEHEAVAMIPAADESQKGQIVETTQRGYHLHDKVLRHAKVVVAQ